MSVYSFYPPFVILRRWIHPKDEESPLWGAKEESTSKRSIKHSILCTLTMHYAYCLSNLSQENCIMKDSFLNSLLSLHLFYLFFAYFNSFQIILYNLLIRLSILSHCSSTNSRNSNTMSALFFSQSRYIRNWL